MRIKTVLYLMIALFITSCGSTAEQGKSEKKKEKTQLVLITTPYGEMKVKLYNETPLHRDNFIKLVKDGFYDSLLFHRVIDGFMIQGGDPDSKGAEAGARLGNGGPGYKIDAEFNKTLIHKKGALAAAREGDAMNPHKKSSGSQFYIVKGNPVPDDMLTKTEERINFAVKRKIMNEYILDPANAGDKNKIDSLRMARDMEGFNALVQQIETKLQPKMEAAGMFTYTEEQREVYRTLGGTPHLDQGYTVFGEVIEGLNVIDSIAKVKTDKFDRPVENVIMEMKLVRK